MYTGATISHCNVQITELKRQLDNLYQRVKRLESLVEEAPSHRKRSVFASKLAWHKGANWNSVKRGMSRLQVETILGKPTSVKTLGNHITLHYRGERSGSGYVSGNVKLNDDDRVWDINRPVF